VSGAFEVAASWLEVGTPEARALGEEIYGLLDFLEAEAVGETVEALGSVGGEAR